MKIIVFSAFYHPLKGGYVNSVAALVEQLAKQNHQVAIVTTNTHNSPQIEITKNIHIFRLPCWNPQFLNGSFPLLKPTISSIKILRNLAAERWDIVNTQTRFYPTSWIGFVFAKIKKIPLVHTERGSSHTIVNSKIIRFCNKSIDHSIGSLIVKKAQKVVGVSQECCEFTKHLGAKCPVRIPNGVDSKLFKPSPKQKIKEKFTKEIIIIFTGRLVFGKGIQDLIDVFGNIIGRFPNIMLFIVGDGNYLSKLQKKVSDLGLKEKIIFFGEKTRAQIARLLAASDIFVNPSYSEGLPTSVLEAGASGLAVIASDVGGTREIIVNGNLGEIVPPKNTEVLENALVRMISNTKRKEIGSSLADFIKNNFDWQIVGQQYQKLFYDCLAEKR